MYHEAHIEPLSKKQVSKLLNAHPVRVKAGTGAKIHLSSEHHKKLHKAGLKGSAITITLDPYAIQHNQHLRDAVGMLRKSGILKGEGFWDDVGSIAKKAGKSAVKALANEVVQYAGPAAGTAFAAAATASGNPELAPVASYLGNELGSRAGKYVNKKIQGMGAKHKRVKKGGAALIDQPFTVREAVNTTGDFIKNPGKTLGFGLKKRVKRVKKCGTALIDQPFTVREAVDKTGQFFKDPAGTLGFGVRHKKHKGKGFVEDIASFGNKLQPVLNFLEPSYMSNPVAQQIGDQVAKSLGMGVKKHRPKRVMSEAQKAALAKGRHALRIKLNEMGAGAHHKHKHHKHSGSALYPAGY